MGGRVERTLRASTQVRIFFDHGFERMTRIARMGKRNGSAILRVPPCPPCENYSGSRKTWHLCGGGGRLGVYPALTGF